jgi:hypothetical protein
MAFVRVRKCGILTRAKAVVLSEGELEMKR